MAPVRKEPRHPTKPRKGRMNSIPSLARRRWQLLEIPKQDDVRAAELVSLVLLWPPRVVCDGHRLHHSSEAIHVDHGHLV